MVGFAALAYGAKQFFTADSFYEYGHYRGKSVAEIASEKPEYKGTPYCTSCHAQQVAEWSIGIHNRPDIGKVVKCEVCHGPAGGRDPETAYIAPSTGPDHPKNMKMIVPADSRQLCTLCHERMTGRPLQQRQIVVADHAGTQQCTVCHNPHSPRLNLVSTSATAEAGDVAAGKTKAATCVGCHGAEGVSASLPGPTLAGQREPYLRDALNAYITGARNDPMMSAGVQGLSNDDAANVAAYFAGAKCISSLDAAKQATLPGKATAATCSACHGADGNSANPSWPSLIGQSKNYLVNALKAYKGGARKNGMMAGVVKDLSDTDIENMASYYANATCK
jgi:cytochrome c553